MTGRPDTDEALATARARLEAAAALLSAGVLGSPTFSGDAAAEGAIRLVEAALRDLERVV